MNRRSFLTKLVLGVAVLPTVLRSVPEQMVYIDTPIPPTPKGYMLNPYWVNANYEVGFVASNETAKRFVECGYRGFLTQYPIRFNQPDVFIEPLLRDPFA